MKNKNKKDLRLAFTILKCELQLNFPIWLVQIILTGSIMLFLLMICLTANSNSSPLVPFFYLYNSSGADIFQSFFSVFLTLISSVFSIIYIAKSLSYLYNKRKLDMYGSMPITRRCFFNSKVFSSFVMSVMVFTAYAVISIVIGIFTGAKFENTEIQNLILFYFFTFFNISLYSLCSVCSKSIVNAIISLYIIEYFLPNLIILIKYIFVGFFNGINPVFIPDKLITNIFSILNGNLIYIVIWFIMGALFLLLCNFIIKKRNPENTKCIFVMPLLEYAIKIILTLFMGLFIGLITGAFTQDNGFTGFIAGFVIVSIATYIIIHIIYNSGFKKLIKNSIVLLALIMVSLVFIWFCNANPMNLNNTVPNKEDIVSAGVIDIEYNYQGPQYRDINYNSILNSANDFTDDKYIDKIISLHNNVKNMQINYNTADKCRISLMKMFTGTETSAIIDMVNEYDYYEDGIIISYKYKNGLVNSYYYSNECQYNVNSDYYIYDSPVNLLDSENINKLRAELSISEKYREKYRPFFTDPDNVISIDIFNIYDMSDENVHSCGISKYTDEFKTENKLFNKFYKDLSEALKEDLKNDNKSEENNNPYIPTVYYENNYSYDVESSYPSDDNNKNTKSKFMVIFNFDAEGIYSIHDTYYIPESYTNTINVLKERGVINDDLSIKY